MTTRPWHALSFGDLEKELTTSIRRGLSSDEVLSRRSLYGPNILSQGKRHSLVRIFFEQFQNPLIYVLLAASIAVFFLGDTVDGFIILFIVFFNALVGTIQEGRAEHTLRALKNFVETNATVLRDSREMIVSDAELVPGDVIFLREGERIPADARIVESHNVRLDEAALTGESVPVHKEARVLPADSLPSAQKINMVFRGTYVVGGDALAIVVATGVDSVIGKISKSVLGIESEIPLRAEIRNISQWIIWIMAGIAAFIFGLGIAYGNSLPDMFKTVVALAVSVIPEGLPVVLTLVLATGAWRMAKQKALIKRLQAVETLGQARVIAVDKTGTLTKNELVIRKVFVDGKEFNISGAGYEPEGDILLNGNAIEPLNHPELLLAGKIAAFTAHASVAFSRERNTWRVTGDPTEAAMLVFAEKIGFKREDLEREWPEVAEWPFDYSLKYHAVLRRGGAALWEEEFPARSSQLVSVAGAPEVLLGIAEKVLAADARRVRSKTGTLPLAHAGKLELEKEFHRMSREGLRVVAFGFYEAPLDEKIELSALKNFVFCGFFGMQDSLRPQVADAIGRAKDAGIRVVMITGDHKITALAIAKEAGIYRDDDEIMTGEELAVLSDRELEARLGTTTVFARVTPEDKMKIIYGYKRRGDIIAMTGDGVNDAPSLVAADLGIAMGNIGTEVAKESADIVLLDDNFDSLIAAIEEGRNIYRTIKRVILYLFSTNIGELLVIVGALFLGYPLPILPAQIIWLNLVTDSFLDVALAMEPKEKDLLDAKFARKKLSLLDASMFARIPGMAIMMMVGTLLVFGALYRVDMARAWTMSLTTLAIFQWFNAWNVRSNEKSVFAKGFFSNRYLILATVIVMALQVAAVYSPVLNTVLKTVPLSLGDWGFALLIAFSIVIIEEARKILSRFFADKESRSLS